MNHEPRTTNLIELFQSVDRQTRLELLVDFAERMPPLPEEYRRLRDAGINRIKECQTPVFLWVDVDKDRVRIIADASPEAPTVRGFVALLVDMFTDATPGEVKEAPDDLLHQLGLDQAIGMTRTRGLSAILQHIKRRVGHEHGR